MAYKVVTITVQDEDITYAPSVLNVRKDDSVRWECPTGRFVVVFPETPFDDLVIHGNLPLGKGGRKTEDVPVTTTEARVYKYQVAICDDASDKTLLNGGCPEVIVRR